MDSALHDAEERLPLGLVVGLRAAVEPGEGSADPRLHGAPLRRKGRALGEGHDDVGAERVLDLDGALGSELHLASVHLVLEANAPFVDLLVRQGKDLEAAAVGQDVSVPAHEGV